MVTRLYKDNPTRREKFNHFVREMLPNLMVTKVRVHRNSKYYTIFDGTVNVFDYNQLLDDLYERLSLDNLSERTKATMVVLSFFHHFGNPHQNREYCSEFVLSNHDLKVVIDDLKTDN